MPIDRARSLRIVALAYAVAFVAALAGGRAVLGSHPIAVALAADLAATFVVFAFSRALDNSSVYDPYWSVAPLPIALYWAWSAGVDGVDPRREVVLALIAIWGVRLTWNWIRRWRGMDDEDWRYAEYRGRSTRGYWAISLFGFHLFPTVIVFVACLPVYVVTISAGRPWSVLDTSATVVTAGSVWLEARADRDLRRFLDSTPGGDAVLETGVWAWSRYPNYLGEIGFWWGLYLFGLAADPSYARTVAGPLAMTALFAFVSIPMKRRRLALRNPTKPI